MIKCTSCGKIEKEEIKARFCREKIHKNGYPCGSLMLPFVEEKPELKKPRKDGE
jgi:hypothetical protein